MFHSRIQPVIAVFNLIVILDSRTHNHNDDLHYENEPSIVRFQFQSY